MCCRGDLTIRVLLKRDEIQKEKYDNILNFRKRVQNVLGLSSYLVSMIRYRTIQYPLRYGRKLNCNEICVPDVSQNNFVSTF